MARSPKKVSKRRSPTSGRKTVRGQALSSAAGWIDVSIPLRNGMVHWPGDPPYRSERIVDIEQGDVCNVSAVSLGSHTGTHMDPPLHYVRRGKGIDELPFSATIGTARVVVIKDTESVKPAELRPHRIRRGERIIFKTVNSKKNWKTDEFVKNFVHISKEGAQFLADRKVRTVGLDYLSIGGYERDGVEAHQAFLRAGVWLIEGLDLARILPGKYELICLPLKAKGGDGAPARAIMRRLTG